jgi:tetrapyrrole methylase family protein / MazG family protein
MDRLRGDGGCPWDRVQTQSSLRAYLLEEAYELLEVLDAQDDVKIREELGDLLLQVVFHSRIAEDNPKGARYDLGDVANGITDKLVRRHAHVFQMGQALQTPEEVLVAWTEHKRQEGRKSVLDGVPVALPALLRAQRIQTKAARVGFDWPDPSGPLGKIEEELEELKVEVAKGDQTRIGEELGDLLFSVVNLARHLEVEAEHVLREAGARFEDRFRQVEACGGDLKALSIKELEALWQDAKARQKSQGPDRT